MSVTISKCREASNYRNLLVGKDGQTLCCKNTVWTDYQFFGFPNAAQIIASKACEDEATWEEEGDAW